MKRRKRTIRTQKKLKEIARERIDILFRQSDEAAHKGELDNANRYIDIVRRIAMKNNIRIPREYKRRFCRFCYKYLLPGKTSRTRINSKEGRIETECFNCGKTIYFPIHVKNKEK
ncbi:MAG TPA: hypothetical protein EYP86_00890 [Candidatus Altiarchaeales archaeon]|nr:hypothetical protein [Candidatus Altiarchaeales archaeon]